MVAGVFRRSLSFPNKNPNRPSTKPPVLSHHIRSISLPCRSHPLISQINDEISCLTTWTAATSNNKPQTSANLSRGLTLLKDAHETLHDILHLPQAHDSLRSHPLFVENLLEDFLRFVDVYGMFQTSILALKEDHSAAQMAIRKRDEPKIALYGKAKKRAAREMEKLVAAIRCVATKLQALPDSSQLATVADAELARVVTDVISATVSVSVALFGGMAASLASRRLTWIQVVKLSRGSGKRVGFKEHEGIEELIEKEEDGVESLVGNMRKKGDEEVRLVLKSMRDFEGCICAIESVTDKVFRALINSRVALLNTLTHTQ